ncbi:MAG: C25 family cysteine peptidase [Bacteroidales bacterium]
MRKLITLFIMLFAFSYASFADGYKVSYSEPQPGTMQLEYTIQKVSITPVTLNGSVYTRIESGCKLHTEKTGWAELPLVTTALQLSDIKNYDVVFTGGDYTDYTLEHPPVPSRGVIYRDQDPSSIPYTIDPASITNRFYPGDKVEMTSPYIIKDVRGATVTVYPFQYNAAKNVLRVYQNFTVQLIENNDQPTNPLTITSEMPLREMIGVYESAFINYDAPTDDLTIAENGEILVICTARDEAAIQPYIDWKTEKGNVVHKEVVSTGTNVDGLVQDMYDANNNILYVLMVGDWNDVKCANIDGTPQDPVTGCVVGNDDYFDIAVGRLAANSAADVTIQVNKIIDYEKDPDLSGTWYETATGVASNQGSGDDGEYDDEHIQIIYDDKLDPFTYNNHNPIYDPTANSTMVTAALETGTSIINYCGHGSSTSWGSSGFSNSHIASLTNGDKLPFIFSVACVNGAYHSTFCFAEAWMNQEGGGAVGALMSTINQPWDPPMRGQDYFNDLIIGGYDYSQHPGQNGITTTEGRTTFGSVVFNGLVLMITESPGDLNTAQTWILFGDPAMQLRTATPADLSYTNNVMLVGTPFETTVTKNGSPFEGAMVALSQNDITHSAVTDASGFVSIPNDFVPGDVQIVITGFNCETIYETIQCIPPTGPYVIYSNYELNDANGNANGILEYFDGNVLLDFAMKNVGVEQASNVQVTISTSDEYVTITDGTENFGNLAAGEVKTITDAFAFDIAGDVPEGHGISFEVVATGQETWESMFTITAYSALLEYEEFTIDDSNGNNNGILDPGETADLIVVISNNGSADAFNVLGTLESLDTYITINTADPQEFGTILGDETGTAAFSVTAASTIPAGYTADLEVNFTADYGFAGSAVFGVLFPDYCYGEANCSYGDGITGFAVAEINNLNNGCSEDNGIMGYGDFTDMITPLDPGMTYEVTMETGYSSQFATIWIDFNDNKEFEESERLLTDFELDNSGQLYYTDITIPDDVPTGTKRMRLRARWLDSSSDPCADFSYGETEDYTVVIGEPAYLPPPENLTAQVNGDDVTLSWNAPERFELMGYNVYRDGVMVANMMTQTTMTDPDCPEGSYWYAVSAVYAEGESGHCNPVQVTIGGFIGKLQGFVRDAVTKISIGDAWVSAMDSDFGAVAYQTPFGSHYTLSLPGGTYNIECSAAGYQSETINNVTVVDNGTSALNFYLYPQTIDFDGREVTGINEVANASAFIYPNPASETITFSLSQQCDVSIFSHTGQMVYQKTGVASGEEISISALEAGVYFVKIIQGSEVSTEKLIIQ